MITQLKQLSMKKHEEDILILAVLSFFGGIVLTLAMINSIN